MKSFLLPREEIVINLAQARSNLEEIFIFSQVTNGLLVCKDNKEIEASHCLKINSKFLCLFLHFPDCQLFQVLVE